MSARSLDTPMDDAEYADGEQQGPVARSGLVAALVFVLLLGMVGLFLLDRLYDPGKFRIEEVEIRGQFERVDPQIVRAAVVEELDGNYFSASLSGIEEVVSDLPWVFDAAVRRRWPDTLVVEVDEIQPVAAWGEDRWLNATGDLVERENWDGDLPRLDGPDGMKEPIWRAFQEWHGLFAAQGLSLDRLEFDERELWYLTLSLSALALERIAPPLEAEEEAVESGENKADAETETDAPLPTAEVTMIVDNTDADARIRRLISALRTQLLAEFPGMQSIDLRYPNGFAIHWTNGAPAPRALTESN